MKIAVLGCGNMAQALVKPLAAKRPDLGFYLYTPSGLRARKLAKDLSPRPGGGPGHVCPTLRDLPPDCTLYLIACKPQHFPSLAHGFRELPPQGHPPLILSIMASISIATISRAFSIKNIVRAMPNTPALIGEGACTVFYPSSLSEEERRLAHEILASTSCVFPVATEKDLDLLTGINACAPAYLFEFSRIIEHYLKERGIPSQMAKELVAQTFLGTSKLLLEKSGEESAEDLRKKVTSRGGVTQAALAIFAREGMEEIWHHALDAAHARAKELALINGPSF